MVRRCRYTRLSGVCAVPCTRTMPYKTVYVDSDHEDEEFGAAIFGGPRKGGEKGKGGKNASNKTKKPGKAGIQHQKKTHDAQLHNTIRAYANKMKNLADGAHIDPVNISLTADRGIPATHVGGIMKACFTGAYHMRAPDGSANTSESATYLFHKAKANRTQYTRTVTIACALPAQTHDPNMPGHLDKEERDNMTLGQLRAHRKEYAKARKDYMKEHHKGHNKHKVTEVHISVGTGHAEPIPARETNKNHVVRITPKDAAAPVDTPATTTTSRPIASGIINLI